MYSTDDHFADAFAYGLYGRAQTNNVDPRLRTYTAAEFAELEAAAAREADERKPDAVLFQEAVDAGAASAFKAISGWDVGKSRRSK